MERRKEGNDLFNNALNTFCLRLYGIRDIVKDYSDSEKGKKERKKERSVLFNDTLNTFYLWLYGIRHILKDYSDSEKGKKERKKCFI